MLSVTPGNYLHIFRVLLIKELSGKGFIGVAHVRSLLVSSRDYAFSSDATRQILRVMPKVRKDARTEVLDG